MYLFESNLETVRAVYFSASERQSLELVIYQAIANTTDLPAKQVEEILTEIARLIELTPEAEVKRGDPAL